MSACPSGVEMDALLGYTGPRLLVKPWPGLPPAERQALADALPDVPMPPARSWSA
jgi:hypothetical protein